MAEMTTLLAAIYRTYTTSGYKQQEGVSPGITSRFEVFYDETLSKFEVSRCLKAAYRSVGSLFISETHMLDQL